MLVPWLPEPTDAVHPLAVLLIALALDAMFGDPPAIWRSLPHPVVVLGSLIGWLDRICNKPAIGNTGRFVLGAITVAIVVCLAACVAWAFAYLSRTFPGGWIVEAIIASTLIAGRALYDHVRAVAAGLEESLAEGRAAVAHIVGRDPESLDEPGVARASIESLAENFSDGVVAPCFWFVVAGLPGLAAYKAINTLDSMIGHRDQRYEWFGKCAARLDDAANWLPARLTGILLVVAAAFVPSADARTAARAMHRDAPRHRSVNAGWQEAPMAGALGLALAGPRRYGETAVEDAWMGDGRRDAGPSDIRNALTLYVAAIGVLALTLVCGLAAGVL